MGGALWSIRRILVVSYPVAILAMVGVIVAVGSLASRDSLDAAARAAMRNASHAVSGKLHSLIDPTERAIAATAAMVGSGQVPWHDLDGLERHLLAMIGQVEGLDGVYMGTSEGAFVFVTRATTGERGFVSKIIAVSEGTRTVTLRRRDPDFRVVSESEDPTDPFDPRVRPWYQSAFESDQPVWTPPYIFYMSQQPGLSIARRTQCHHLGLVCVVGADLTLAGISDFLTGLTIGSSGRALLVTGDHRLIAAPSAADFFRSATLSQPDPHLPSIDALPSPLARAALAAHTGTDGSDVRFATFAQDGQAYLSSVQRFDALGQPLLVATWVPRRDFFGWVDDLQWRIAIATLAIGALATLGAGVFGHRLTRALTRVHARVSAMPTLTTQSLPPPASRLREIRVLEEALVESVRAQRAAEAALYAALEEAVRASRAKSEFLAHMSHELRTPLNAILGFIELLRMRVGNRLPERELGYLADIAAAARHLTDVLGSILEFAAAESGRLNLKEEVVALDDAIGSVMSMLGQSAREKRIAMTWTGGRGLAVRVDAVKFREILLNLVSNAVKYTPPDGTITISPGVTEHDVTITVQDTGIGMSVDEAKRALEPFARIVTNPYVASASGIGIGLTVASVLAELHGGAIELSSKPGAGTRATVRLPIERRADAGGARRADT